MSNDATAAEPVVLYPQSRQFPFDEVCEQIVRALEARQWKVPGIRVELAEHCHMVRIIRGRDFKLHFSRPQWSPGRRQWNTAAVATLAIPGKKLCVFADESGPSLYVYVGNDWELDRDRFIDYGGVGGKYHGEPRWYLYYSGGNLSAGSAVGRRSGRRPALLIHDNLRGTEYDREEGEPVSYDTEAVMAEFTAWLRDNALTAILGQPIADADSPATSEV